MVGNKYRKRMIETYGFKNGDDLGKLRGDWEAIGEDFNSVLGKPTPVKNKPIVSLKDDTDMPAEDFNSDKDGLLALIKSIPDHLISK